MTTRRLSGKWRQRPLLFRFLATLYFFAMFSNSSVFAQLNCNPTNCTSNDVRVVSAYISGPNNAPIDCGSANPFNNAELHLIVSSNTQRIGASIVGTLNLLKTGTSVSLAHCFSGITINNGSNNNLVYQLGTALSGLTCPSSFSLTNLFISWGTGNTNFCTSEAAQCPATPAKCRFNAGETIPVTVKLDVDFTFTPGICDLGGNSLAVDFTPVITAQNLTAPFTYTWDFGDNTATNTGTANDLSSINGVSHTYATAGTYTVSLTITDNVGNTKTGINSLVLTSCCNLSAPKVTAGPFCSADGTTIGKLPQTDGNGGTYHWYNAADPNNSFELDPSTVIPVGTNTYYVSVASGNCESQRTAVTITVNQTPTAPIISGPICVGATSITGTSSAADGTTITVFDGASQIGTARVTTGAWSATVTAVSAGDVITATATSAACQSGVSAAVTVSANTATPTVIAACAGATTVTGTNETGAAVEVFVNGTSVGLATVTDGTWSTTVSALSANDQITAIATVSGKCASVASAAVTVSANTATPTVKAACAGATTVTGTNETGATVEVFVNGTSVGLATVTDGTWSKTVSALSANDQITAIATVSGKCASVASAAVTVSANTATPTVLAACAGATTVTGTNETGATVEVFVNGTSVGLATVTDGTWSKTVSALSANDQITAIATVSGKCASVASAAATVSANTATPTVSSVCAGATTVTGTNETGATVEVFVNGTSVGLATVNGGNWSKTVSALSANDQITAIATFSGKCASAVSGISTVNPLPNCTISSSGSPTSTTLGSKVTFSSTANPSGTYSYTWGFSSNTSGASFVGSATTSDASVTVTTSTVGSYTLTLTVTNTQTKCFSSSACSYRMTVTPAGPYYTVTQGFYGNVGGKVCMAGTSYTAGTKSSVPGLIETSISNMANQTLFLGSTGKSFTMGNTSTEANNLIKYMPGGQTPVKLAGAYNITKALPPLNNGKIANVFLTQSITLALNISIPGNSLGGFVLKSGYLTTQKINSATCPSTTLLSCSASSSAISSLQITTNTALVSWMNGKTVQDLLNLASGVLGGATPPTGVSLSDINNAIDVINRSFDGGAAFLGYYPNSRSCSSNFTRDMTTPTAVDLTESVNKLTITAYPNPFTNKVQFSVVSPVSGMASLDVYNIVGQKLKTVYQGYLQAGSKQIIEYNVPSPYKGALIYTLKVGDQQVNGKVVQLK